MKIYKYNQSGWRSFNESIKDKKDSKVLKEDYIINNGELVSLQEYFADHNRNFSGYWNCATQKWVDKDYSYGCCGKPTNCLERLAYAEIEFDGDLYYCDLVKNSPEDLCKSRTDWEDLKGYADGFVSFINQLKDEIAQNIIKT